MAGTRRTNRAGTVSSYSTTSGALKWRIAYWLPGAAGADERRVFRKGYESEQEAREALEAVLVDLRRGEHHESSRETLQGYAETYLDTIRVRASTLAGYRKHWRVHIAPSVLAPMRLSAITKDDLNRLYRQLEKSGRKDHGHEGEPLAASTVRHVHVLLSQVLQAAVEDDLIRTNPAKRASPPSKLEAAAPEMTTWSEEESRAFLAWSDGRGDYLWLAWRTLLSTGLRRGEFLALRWRDLDSRNRVLHVARSLSYVKEAGTPPSITFTKPKSGRGRNVDIDQVLVDAMLERRQELQQVAPELATADALIFPNRYGRAHNPVQFSRQWRERVAQAQEELPQLPTIHLHETRHTHATLLLRAGVHPKIVSERLGHATPQITMEIYSHAVQSLQRDAATIVGGMLAS